MPVINLPETVLGWGGVLGLAVTGFFAFVGVFDRSARRRREDADAKKSEADAAETRLITAMKEELGLLNRKYENQEGRLNTAYAKINKLETENKLLLKIVEGRDEETKAHRELVTKMFETVDATHKMIEQHLVNQSATA